MPTMLPVMERGLSPISCLCFNEHWEAIEITTKMPDCSIYHSPCKLRFDAGDLLLLVVGLLSHCRPSSEVISGITVWVEVLRWIQLNH